MDTQINRKAKPKGRLTLLDTQVFKFNLTFSKQLLNVGLKKSINIGGRYAC